MDLRDALLIERYRLAVNRQEAMLRGSRGAMTTYAVAVCVVGLTASVMAAGNDSLGLSQHTMPDVYGVLAWLVVLFAAAALIHIGTCVVRRGRARDRQRDLDPEAPPHSAGWWLPDALYIVLVVASAIGAWNAFAELGEAVMRGSS